MDKKRKPETDEDEPVIDPAQKGKRPATEPTETTIGQSGTRHDNETDASRATDGARKRAEQGL